MIMMMVLAKLQLRAKLPNLVMTVMMTAIVMTKMSVIGVWL